MSETFNTFDLIFIAFSFIFVVVAFFRGFVKELFSMIIWIAALCISYFFAPLLAKLFSSYSDNKLVLDVAARIILFVASFFTLLLSTSGLVDDIKDKMPSILDRSLGVLYGICKTLIIFGAFYAITANLYGFLLGKKQDPEGKKVPAWMLDAKCGNILRVVGETVDPAVEAFIGAITKNLNKPGFLPKTLDDKVDEIIGSDSSEAKNKIDSGGAAPSGETEKDTGYNKKDIDKMNRLIDVIEKIN